jgi:hypothetical protein
MAATAALLVLPALLWAVPVGAEHDDGYGEHPTFDRSPARGPGGTVIKLWGTGCIYRGTPWEKAQVYMSSVSKEPGSHYYTSSDEFPVKDDGSWEGQFVVPQEAALGDYVLNAGCYASDMRLEAGRLPFTVAAPTSPTSSTTTTTTTTTTTAPRPRRATTTTTTTTTTAPPTTSTVPAPVVAAPGADDHPPEGGGPRWGLLAAATAALLGGGTAVTGALRRRRTTRGTGQSG